MTTLLSILAILAVLGVVASVTALFTDGYRPVRTNWTRVREYGEPAEHGTAPLPTPEPASTHNGGRVAPRRGAAHRARRPRVTPSR